MLLDYALRADSLPLFQAEISDVPSTPSGREAGARAASRRGWRIEQHRAAGHAGAHFEGNRVLA